MVNMAMHDQQTILCTATVQKLYFKGFQVRGSLPLVVHDHHVVANQLLESSACIDGLKLCPAPERRSAGLQKRVLLWKTEF